jgi:Tfp pilus assembly protein PilN
LIIRVNLLPEKKRIELPSVPILPFFLLIVLGVAAYILWVPMTSSLNQDIDRLNKDVENLEKKKRQVIGNKQDERNKKKREIDWVQQQIQMIKRLTGDDILPWSRTFEDLTEVVPKETVWLKNASYESTQRFSIQGVARPKVKDELGNQIQDNERMYYEPVRDFMKKLEEHPHFDSVFLSSANLAKLHNEQVVNFAMTCRIKKGGGMLNE